MKLSRLLLPFFAAGMLVFALWSVFSQPEKPELTPPLAVMPRAFANQVVGIGTVEPLGEAVNIAAGLSGLVTEVMVKTGDAVNQGDVLFRMDDRSAKAAVKLAASAVAVADTRLLDAKDQLARSESVKQGVAIGVRALSQQRFAVKTAAAALVQARAELEAAQVMLERHTITAPRSGTILQVNIRAGEYAAAAPLAKPLIIMGDTSAFQIRTEIDEYQAARVQDTASAVAYNRGQMETKIPLTFLRKEPIIAAKRSLTGDRTERVDTRVLQVLYRVENSPIPLSIEQELEVSIETEKLKMEGR